MVAKDFHAKHALRDASRPNLTVDALNSFRNQASRMDRDSQSALRNLLRLQAERRKAEDALRPAAMERSGYWFKDSSLMAPQAPCSHPNQPPSQTIHSAPALEQMEPAEQFAAIYPKRAALIRAHGGLPPDIDFGAPEPDLVAAIVACNSNLMQELVDVATTISPRKTESRKKAPRDTDDTPIRATHPVT